MRTLSLVFAAAALTACAPKSDSAAVADSVPGDSTTMATPAESLPPTTVTPAAPTKADLAVKPPAAPSKLKSDSIIGRDSAFGPKYTIDANGKLVPIRKP